MFVQCLTLETIKLIDDRSRAERASLVFHYFFNKWDWKFTTMAMSQFCGHQFLEVGHKNEISIVKEVHAKHTQTRTHRVSV